MAHDSRFVAALPKYTTRRFVQALRSTPSPPCPLTRSPGRVQVYDLLHPSANTLPVRWNKQHGFFVQGLLVLDCHTLDDIMAIVSEGHRNRRTGSHELNKDSSRSHRCVHAQRCRSRCTCGADRHGALRVWGCCSILSINVEAESADPDDGHIIVKHGKLLFVDLAGSERLKESKNEGLAAVETGSINKSLFILVRRSRCLTVAARATTNALTSWRAGTRARSYQCWATPNDETGTCRTAIRS